MEEAAGGAETVIEDGAAFEVVVVVVLTCFTDFCGENAAVVGVEEAVEAGCCWLWG